jgi:glucose dehydrogenase
MRSNKLALLLCMVLALGTGLSGQKATKPVVDQWPTYMYKSDFSPLTQITPQNVARLTEAWTLHYGAGSANA